mmetsp:Transcript_13523/g.31435  ORF Transcript_13523/g.31435 Transcript_13523/m.31435 type:complete len:223 (+) Transcript_13523:1272-1940(+)
MNPMIEIRTPRYVAMPMLFGKGFQFSVSFVPTRFTYIPYKSNLLQTSLPFRCQGTRYSFPSDLVLLPLSPYPRGKTPHRGGRVARDVAMPMLVVKGLQFLVSFIPSRLQSIPRESNLIQQFLSFRCHATVFSLLGEFLLDPLIIDPSDKTLRRRGEGYIAMPMFLTKGLQFPVSLIPTGRAKSLPFESNLVQEFFLFQCHGIRFALQLLSVQYPLVLDPLVQ